MTEKIDHDRETLVEAIRRLADLQDVQRAISVAARLSAEKLAHNNSDFYQQLGKDPEQLMATALELLAKKFRL